MKSFQITEYCHFLMEQFTENPRLCIDATMGNGTDTLFLCRLAGPEGKVIAFDIQKQALENTGSLLEKEGCLSQCDLICDSHENIDAYFAEESADLIVFNFGYLPGGDHSLATKPEISIKAVKKSLGILKKGGVMCLCLYSGGDSGFAEKELLLGFLKELDAKRFLVITHEYWNRPNHPPMPVLIRKF